MRRTGALTGVLVAVGLVGGAGVVAPARADCGDPGESACAGPAPTVEQVDAVLARRWRRIRHRRAAAAAVLPDARQAGFLTRSLLSGCR